MQEVRGACQSNNLVIQVQLYYMSGWPKTIEDRLSTRFSRITLKDFGPALLGRTVTIIDERRDRKH